MTASHNIDKNILKLFVRRVRNETAADEGKPSTCEADDHFLLFYSRLLLAVHTALLLEFVTMRLEVATAGSNKKNTARSKLHEYPAESASFIFATHSQIGMAMCAFIAGAYDRKKTLPDDVILSGENDDEPHWTIGDVDALAHMSVAIAAFARQIGSEVLAVDSATLLVPSLMQQTKLSLTALSDVLLGYISSCRQAEKLDLLCQSNCLETYRVPVRDVRLLIEDNTFRCDENGVDLMEANDERLKRILSLRRELEEALERAQEDSKLDIGIWARTEREKVFPDESNKSNNDDMVNDLPHSSVPLLATPIASAPSTSVATSEPAIVVTDTTCTCILCGKSFPDFKSLSRHQAKKKDCKASKPQPTPTADFSENRARPVHASSNDNNDDNDDNDRSSPLRTAKQRQDHRQSKQQTNVKELKGSVSVNDMEQLKLDVNLVPFARAIDANNLSQELFESRALERFISAIHPVHSDQSLPIQPLLRKWRHQLDEIASRNNNRDLKQELMKVWGNLKQQFREETDLTFQLR